MGDSPFLSSFLFLLLFFFSISADFFSKIPYKYIYSFRVSVINYITFGAPG